MKCVQNTTTNEIKRVSDDRALDLTSKGWRFVPKSAWKAAPDTTWVKASEPANPESDRKVRRREMRNR